MPRTSHAAMNDDDSPPRGGGPSGSGLTPQVINDLRKKGYNQTQIAEMYGISRSGVSYIKNSAGTPYRTPREAAMDSFPWKDMASKFKAATPYHRATDHLEYVATGGKGMAPYKLQRLRSWYQMMQELGVVLEFDPSNPPRPNLKSGGWDYKPRESEDGDLLIRVNRYTTLSDEGYEIWRIPDKVPE